MGNIKIKRLFRLNLVTAILLLSGTAVLADTVIMLTPFQNAQSGRRWDWISAAIEEGCRRNMEQWKGAVLYPALQPLPDSAEYCLFGAKPVPAGWRSRWRSDVVIGGKYKAKGKNIKIWMHFCFLNAEGRKDSVRISGKTDDVHHLIVDVCKAIAKKIKIPMESTQLKQLNRYPSKNPNAYSAYAAGYMAWKNAQQDIAVFALVRALELDPKLSEASHLLGQMYYRMGDMEKALAYLTAAADQDASNMYFQIDLARALLGNNREEEAKKILSSLQRVYGDYERVLNLQGIFYLRQGLYGRATAMFLKALTRNPSCWEYCMNLGTTYFRQGQIESAIEQLEKLISITPPNARYYTMLGIAYRRAEQLKKSIDMFETALRINPNSVLAMMNMATSYMELKWFQKAEYWINKAIYRSPAEAVLYCNKGAIKVRKGDTTAAVPLFEKALKLDPDNFSAYNNLGAVYIHQKKWKKARDVLEKALAAGGKRTPILLNLTAVYEQLGEEKKVMAYLEDAVFLDPSNLQIRRMLADVLKKNDLLQDAVNVYEDYLEIKPESETARIHLSHLLIKMDLQDEAIEMIESVIQSNPGNADYLMELANLYRKIEWYDVASLKYLKVVEIQPKKLEALWGLGACYYQIAVSGTKTNPDDYFNKALYYLKSALTIDPANLDARYYMGLVLLDFKEDGAAVRSMWAPMLNSSYRGMYKKSIKSRKRDLRKR